VITTCAPCWPTAATRRWAAPLGPCPAPEPSPDKVWGVWQSVCVCPGDPIISNAFPMLSAMTYLRVVCAAMKHIQLRVS
jgi:hypothetical protein